MISYLVELRYKPEVYRPVRARHRNYLADLARQGKLLFAGRFADDTGSVFLYSGETEEEVRQLMDHDPYILEGVVADRVIREFVPGVAFQLAPADRYE